MTDTTIHVEGLSSLQRAFKAADVAEQRELRKTMRAVVEPVRVGAERLAVEQITRIGVPWSRMRVGVTNKSVYLAPRERGQKGRDQRLRRPNLRPLLLGSMEEAFDHDRAQIIVGFESMLTTVGRKWEATP